MGCNNWMGNGTGAKQLERARYYSRQLMTADDMTVDQEYFQEKLRRHNRFLHGWGIVCGLDIIVDPKLGGLNLLINPGYALSPQGDEIYVPEKVSLDLAKCALSADAVPCTPGCGPQPGSYASLTGPIYVVIKYAQCASRPVRTPPVGCGCDETACEYSRIRDSFEIGCLNQIPESYLEKYRVTGVFGSMIGTGIVPCLPCPVDPWVVLATITASGQQVDSKDISISNGDRRLVLGTGLLQHKLVGTF